MRILIHAANLTAGGGLSVGKNLIGAWLRAGEALFILASPPIAAFLQKEKVPPSCWIEVPQSPGSSFRAGAIFRQKARQAERSFRPDVVFTVFGPPLWKPRAPHLCGFANGLYFPKTPVLPFGEKAGWKEKIIHRLRRWLVFRSVKKDTNALWVETEAARRKLLATVGTKTVYMVPNELPGVFQKAVVEEKTAAPKLPFKVLMVAAAYPHKNFSLLRAVAAFPQIRERFLFQTTLSERDFNRYFSLNKNVQNLGPLSPEHLVAAYQNADFVFCPSRAEIFSATWLEAMAAGRPLLCADIGEARAVCGNAALYFTDNHPQSAATALLTLAADVSLQKKLIQNGRSRLLALTPTTPRADWLHDLLHLMVLNATS